MVIRNRGTRERPEQAIDFALIVTLLLQRGLHVRDHLIGWQIVIGVDRAIVSIICVGIVAPCRDPIARIPSIPPTVYENDAVVMVPPPVPLMPL